RRMPWDDPAAPLAESLMVARWPSPPEAWIDETTETRFGTFLAVVGAIREIRARQNVPPKTRVKVVIRAARETAALLEPMQAAIASMAVAEITALGPEATGAAGAATANVLGCDIFVDLADLIDVGAEIARLTKENEKLAGFIAAKRAKLADGTFASKAPPAVVEKERAQLADLEEKLAKGQSTLAALQARP
ncbi:MAG: class I tRNA ligase family protein, partial [Planctomycetia bacterium]